MESLDNLYREKLKDLHRDPLPGAFEKINAQLPSSVAPGTEGGWVKTIFSSKLKVVKILVAVVAASALLYFILNSLSDKKQKDNFKLREEVVPSGGMPDSVKTDENVESAVQDKTEKEQRKKESKSDKKTKKVIPAALDTINNVVPARMDSVSQGDKKAEEKPKKPKRKKKYEDLYKDGTQDQDSTIRLFK